MNMVVINDRLHFVSSNLQNDNTYGNFNENQTQHKSLNKQKNNIYENYNINLNKNINYLSKISLNPIHII